MDGKKFKKIICFGEVLWDMLPNGKKPGGAPMNVAIHLKKLGEFPIVVSRIGNDAQGEELKQFLAANGLQTQYIGTDEKLPSSEVLVNLDESKNATYEICEPVAWDNILISGELDQLASSAGLFIFGTLAQRNKTTRETLFHLIENSGSTKLLDVNLRPPYDSSEIVEELLHKADFAKFNDEELALVSSWNGKSGNDRNVMKWLADFYNCKTLCVTRGAKGALLFTGGVFFEHHGFKVEAVDTVGAGDSFLAALVSTLFKGENPQKALEFACAVGAFVASQSGAVPEYSATEIEGIMQNV